MVTEVVVVEETEPSEKKLVELELEVDVLLEEEELVEVEEKADAPCMFRRYGHCQGPWMVVTTWEPSSIPLNMQADRLQMMLKTLKTLTKGTTNSLTHSMLAEV